MTQRRRWVMPCKNTHKIQNTMVLWGQSLRASVTVTALAAQIENEPSHKSDSGVIESENVEALGQRPVLEAPFPVQLHFACWYLSVEVAAMPLSLPFLMEPLGQQTSFTSHNEAEPEAKSAHLASRP